MHTAGYDLTGNCDMYYTLRVYGMPYREGCVCVCAPPPCKIHTACVYGVSYREERARVCAWQAIALKTLARSLTLRIPRSYW